MLIIPGRSGPAVASGDAPLDAIEAARRDAVAAEEQTRDETQARVRHPVQPDAAGQHAKMEWLIFGGICLLAFLVSIELDLFERFADFTHAHEAWQLDEFATLLLVCFLGLGAKSLRQARHLRREVVRRRDAESMAEQLALHDVLTGLPNRRQFIRQGTTMLDQARRHGCSVAALYIDLDRFKPVNDLMGHGAGDQVLREVGKRLRDLVREDDVVARLGGDEFAILVRLREVDGAIRLVRRLVLALKQDMVVQGRTFSIGGSVGVALFPQDAKDGETLLRQADTAMYRAKTASTGSFCFFEAGMDRAQQDRAALETDLRLGIGRGEIVPYFQPLVDLQSGAPQRYEVLARWQHPTRGLVLPGDFIPLAEDSGLIGELTIAIMRAAFSVAASWPNQVPIAVNISALHLKDPALAAIVLSLLIEAGLAPQRLEVEITESAVAENMQSAKRNMEQLKAAGVSIALDDFGTGYSSLSTLRALPFDRIKIDRSFVSNLILDADSAKVVAAIIGLSRNLGLRTTAEGIEDAEVADVLRQLGCDEGQGFLYGKAVPASEIPSSVA